ncbi:MAG: DoxX family protein [Odoribacteraceae bacterium]|jgi:uncharacterized membrane protein YphA (DoxX/SURF4 family)|nr:DoxX family protein [Odoribacteraceae bacterium]
MSLARNFCRLLLAVVLVYSGFVKGVDPLGSMYKFIEYARAAGINGIDGLALLAAFLLSLLEFLTGIALLFNLRTRLATRLALLLMLFFTPFTLFTAIVRPVSDCGCFGDALPLTPWQSFAKNLVLLALALLAHARRKRFASPLPAARQLAALLLAAIAMTAVSLRGYLDLPLIDFRPYAEGKNIAAQMQPTATDGGAYSVALYYKNKKTGEIKAFTEEDYPWQDDAWTHERTERTRLQAIAPPAIRDFSIENAAGEDVTGDILEADEYVLLIAARRLDRVTRETQARINRLAYHARRRGYRVIGLTSATTTDINDFSKQYRPPYDLCTVDDAQLKTMIRSNPGILLLHRGVIIAKRSRQNIPEVSDLQGADLLPYLLESQRTRRDNLLVTSLALALLAAYLLLRPARARRRDAYRNI